MKYQRLLDLNKYSSSAFIFGPRMTGKTSLLRQIPNSIYFDLLDPELELKFRTQPAEFWRQINALPAKQTIIIDEVQRVPQLLDYVQMGIDRHAHKFFLSGSSARKLKRGAANLLGGRALDLRLHPLTHQELKDDFDLNKVLSFGSLPKISDLVSTGAVEEARMLLRSYYSTYIRGLSRNRPTCLAFSLKNKKVIYQLSHSPRALEARVRGFRSMREISNNADY